MKRALLALSLTILSCGDPTDNPEDCTSGEFFDQARKLCFTCPAIREPVCDGGCGFTVVADEDDGCPVAECITPSDTELCCGQDEFFSQTSLTCQACVLSPECPEPPEMEEEEGEEEEQMSRTRVISDDTCTIRCE